jgi:hypothetical protein
LDDRNWANIRSGPPSGRSLAPQFQLIEKADGDQAREHGERADADNRDHAAEHFPTTAPCRHSPP